MVYAYEAHWYIWYDLKDSKNIKKKAFSSRNLLDKLKKKDNWNKIGCVSPTTYIVIGH